MVVTKYMLYIMVIAYVSYLFSVMIDKNAEKFRIDSRADIQDRSFEYARFAKIVEFIVFPVSALGLGLMFILVYDGIPQWLVPLICVSVTVFVIIYRYRAVSLEVVKLEDDGTVLVFYKGFRQALYVDLTDVVGVEVM